MDAIWYQSKGRQDQKDSRHARERQQHISYMATLHTFNSHFLTAEVAGNVISQTEYDLLHFFEKRYSST